MKDIHLHIISFDIPYPANYGGVIDVFYKIKSLNDLGIKIHLHTFEYGRKRQKYLETICFEVNYYKRNKCFFNLFSTKPFIVKSRDNKNVLKKLLSDNYPILFEGIHSTYYLSHPSLKSRVKFVRTHNIEHNYYEGLAKSESNFFKKLFFKLEAKKLLKFEDNLKNSDIIFSLSPNDQLFFDNKFNNSEYVSAFHSNSNVSSQEGKGKYILYHGNLSVAENIKSVNFLIKNVFSILSFPVVIAGKNPHFSIIDSIKNYKNIKIIPNPHENEMQGLIANAHICILHTFQATGIKLKLLDSLFAGRFCIANSIIVENTGLEELCSIKNTSDEIISEISNLFDIDFKTENIIVRKEKLSTTFSNSENALKILKHLKTNE
ncbi:MAG: hypothetical protein A2W98_14485 [Bacteroidetes bacterium GWF2_33_38]|nr:MAG: hypothetical protein A2W98_14485 [Bacteroidetes bacterium GWF2_33_38]